jgi:hypothetical protein
MQLSQFLANPAALQRHFLKDIHEVGEFSGATTAAATSSNRKQNQDLFR